MTDEERLRAIRDAITMWNQGSHFNGGPDTDATIAAVRAILDDAPSVEWTTEPPRVIGITRDTEIVIMPDGPREPPGHRILMTGLVEEPEWLDVYVLGDLASAQRRAVALYVALRGVTCCMHGVSSAAKRGSRSTSRAH